MLLVAQPTSGGVGRCVAQLAVAGAAAGLDMRVACPEDGPLAAEVGAAEARWIPFELTRQPSPRDPRRATSLRRLAADVDVVHLHSSKAGVVGRLAVRSLGERRPACAFTPHGWSWQSGGPLTPAYRWLERGLAPLADRIVAVSEEDAAAGRHVLGPRATVAVIENGVDTDHFAPGGPVAARDTGSPLIVVVGRLAHPKGQDVAVRALAEVRHGDARLRLVGDGPDRAPLLELAGRLGVADRIELVGQVDDAAVHLRAADVVVVPSYSEGLSLAMLEAMACARAVVATAVAGSSALGDAGIVVPVGDHRALAEAVDGLLADPDRRHALGDGARRRAEDRYTLRRSTDRHLALWAELAE